MGRHPGAAAAHGAATAATATGAAARAHQHFHSAPCARRHAHSRSRLVRRSAAADGDVPAAAGATRAATLRATAATPGRDGAPACVVRAGPSGPGNLPDRATETGRTGAADATRCGADMGRETCVPASNLGWHTDRSAAGASSCATQARGAGAGADLGTCPTSAQTGRRGAGRADRPGGP